MRQLEYKNIILTLKSYKDEFLSAVLYTIATLLEIDEKHELMESEVICYGRDAGANCKLQIIPAKFFEDGIYGRPESLPEIPLKEVEGIPLLFGEPRIEKFDHRLVVHADIIASAYFMLTRYEEWVRKEVRDEHGRFPGKESLPYRAGFIDRPIVDEYAQLLRKWLKTSGIKIPESGRDFRVLLTHDIDFTLRYPNPMRTIAGAILGRKPKSEGFEAVRILLGLKKDTYDTYEKILELDGSLREVSKDRIESVFFFMAGDDDRHRWNYDVNSRHTRKVLRRIKAAGADIGLHASYLAGENPAKIKEEADRLSRVCGLKVERNRHHFLRWREISDGGKIADAGITWDSTMGYADLPGFRMGTCNPFPLFNPETLDYTGIEEHPLIMMECSFSFEKYMALQEEDAWEYAEYLIKQVVKHSGELVLLWHNTEFSESKPGYNLRLYQRILKYLKAYF